jgi:hypothetical protein
MKKDDTRRIASQWARLGAMFNTPPANENVDVERLLLDTARHTAGNSRLLILAVTWLAKYGQFVAKHRLARLIRHELQAEARPTLGLILDLARQKSANNSHRFNRAIDACGHALDHQPLLDIDRRNEFFIQAARKSASALSLKWGRWMADFELKEDAIRPPSWIIQNNPSLQWRADFKGDLRASILAELDANPESGESESELARACGAARAAVVEAVDKLELSGRARRMREQNRLIVLPAHQSGHQRRTEPRHAVHFASRSRL